MVTKFVDVCPLPPNASRHNLVGEVESLATQGFQPKEMDDLKRWTIVLMERGSRFLWELHCDCKDQSLFEQALKGLVPMIEQTGLHRKTNTYAKAHHHLQRTLDIYWLVHNTTWKVSAPEGGANPHLFVPERKNELF